MNTNTLISVLVFLAFMASCSTNSADAPAPDTATHSDIPADEDAGDPGKADTDASATSEDSATGRTDTAADADVSSSSCDPPCEAPLPHCFAGTCVECLEDAHCPDSCPCAEDHRCDCDPCGDACVPPYPGCAVINGVPSCVPCTEDAHCSGPGNYCNADTYVCAFAYDDCGGSHCVEDGCPEGDGFDLRCDETSGCCYDTSGLCGRDMAFCLGPDSSCLSSEDITGVPLGGLAMLPAIGYCTCDAVLSELCTADPTLPACEGAALCPEGVPCVPGVDILRFYLDQGWSPEAVRQEPYGGGVCFAEWDEWQGGVGDRLRLAGEYEVVTSINLVSGLPNAIIDVHYHVFDFLRNPALSLLRLACTIEDADGVTDGLCSLVFEQSPDGDLVLTDAGTAVTDVINVCIGEISDEYELGEILVAVSHPIDDLFSNIRMAAHFSFDSEGHPDTGELPPGSATALWTSLSYRWAFGRPDCIDDPDCGWTELSLSPAAGSRAAGEPVIGAFTGRVNPNDESGVAAGSRLAIDSHELGLRYGALANHLYRDALLPRLFGGIPDDGRPVVDSWSEMLKSCLAGRDGLATEAAGGTSCCEQFTADVLTADPTLSGEVLSAGCARLVEAGAAQVEDLFLGMDSEVGGWTIGTTPNQDCVLMDQDDDGYVDMLNTPQQPGQWSVDLDFVGTTVTLPASFYGYRL